MRWTKELVLELLEKYGSRGSLWKQNENAYSAALRHGWLEELGYPSKKRSRTYDVCYEIAKTCRTKKEFYEKSKTSYQTAHAHKWLKDYTWFENGKIKWTPESCELEARKYHTLTEFNLFSNSAYRTATRNNWIQNYAFLERNRDMKKKTENNLQVATQAKQRQPKYTYEECLNESKKYHNRSQFKKNARRLYYTAETYGWLPQFTWLKPRGKQGEQTEPRKRGRTQIWSFETVCAESKRYHTLQEFRINSPKAYYAANRNGWQKQFTWLERKKAGVKKLKQTESSINWDALRLEAVKTILPLVMQANPNGSPRTLSRTAIQHADELIERVQNANKK